MIAYRHGESSPKNLGIWRTAEYLPMLTCSKVRPPNARTMSQRCLLAHIERSPKDICGEASVWYGTWRAMSGLDLGSKSSTTPRNPTTYRCSGFRCTERGLRSTND